MSTKTIQKTTYDVDEVLQQGDLLAEQCESNADKGVFTPEVIALCLVVNFAANAPELIKGMREKLRDDHDIDCDDEESVDGYLVAALYVARDDADHAEEIFNAAKQVAHILYEENATE